MAEESRRSGRWAAKVRAGHALGVGEGAALESPAELELPRGRESAIAWAIALMADPAVVFLDTETTGLGPEAEVVDLAVVGWNGGVLLETLIKPIGEIPRESSAVHGIRASDVASAPSWSEVHGMLCKLLEGRPIVVYNAPFDRRMVEQCGARHMMPLPLLRWECAMRAFARFDEVRDSRGRPRWQKLERAVGKFGAAPGGHRAAADALACRAVVVGMAAAKASNDPGDPT